MYVDGVDMQQAATTASKDVSTIAELVTTIWQLKTTTNGGTDNKQQWTKMTKVATTTTTMARLEVAFDQRLN